MTKAYLSIIRKNLREIKVSIGRLEFCRDYVMTGLYDAALKRRRPRKAGKAAKRNVAPNEIFIRSPEWRGLRAQAIRRYGAVCMKCGTSAMINADHIKPKSKYPELALDIDNLQILCWPCNKEKGNKTETDYRHG